MEDRLSKIDAILSNASQEISSRIQKINSFAEDEIKWLAALQIIADNFNCNYKNPEDRISFSVGCMVVSYYPSSRQIAWKIFDKYLNSEVILDNQCNIVKAFAVIGLYELENKEITNRKYALFCARHTLRRLSEEVEKIRSGVPDTYLAVPKVRSSNKKLSNRKTKAKKPWNTNIALDQMVGMERSCKLLLGDAHVLWESCFHQGIKKGGTSDPVIIHRHELQTGVSVSAMVICAQYCETSIKALHSSIKGNEGIINGHCPYDLYEKLENDYPTDKPEDLDTAIHKAISSYQAVWKDKWTITNIKETLKLGRKNYQVKYSLIENQEFKDGIPHQLLIIGKGLEKVCRDYQLFMRHSRAKARRTTK